MKDLFKIKIIEIIINRIGKEIENLAPHLLRVVLEKLIQLVSSFENRISMLDEEKLRKVDKSTINNSEIKQL